MKKTMILETLAAALFAVGQAHAAPISLEHASITATYQGSGAGIFGYSGNYGTNNVSTLDPTGNNVEFITGDGLFAFDFLADGELWIYANGSPDAGANYAFTFDFGNTLPAPITGFALTDYSGVEGGLPGLTVIDSHSIGLNLAKLTWNGDFIPVTAQLDSAPAPSNVPEPASLALALAGMAGLGLSRRARR